MNHLFLLSKWISRGQIRRYALIDRATILGSQTYQSIVAIIVLSSIKVPFPQVFLYFNLNPFP
jgi:hypothetical protein